MGCGALEVNSINFALADALYCYKMLNLATMKNNAINVEFNNETDLIIGMMASSAQTW